VSDCCFFGFCRIACIGQRADLDGRQVIQPAGVTGAFIMNKDQVKGVAEKAKGKVNEVVGRATGDTKQEVKGNVQQAVGEVQKKYGDAKEAIKNQAK
jgi:uncharacterized protein YjbJ (UPF0337 family)